MSHGFGTFECQQLSILLIGHFQRFALLGTEDDEEEEDWEKLFDDEGDCLDPEAKKEVIGARELRSVYQGVFRKTSNVHL